MLASPQFVYALALDSHRFAILSACAEDGAAVMKVIDQGWAALCYPGDEECAIFNAVLRDVFGPPQFRPVRLDFSWLTWHDGALRKMAQAIYDERRFADLPILADALEDAGCADAAILAHCREPGEHVRGCWCVDLLLGKT